MKVLLIERRYDTRLCKIKKRILCDKEEEIVNKMYNSVQQWQLRCCG